MSATFRGFFAVPDYDTRALIPAAVRTIFIGLVILIGLDFDDVIEVFYVPKTSKDDLNDDSHDNDDDDDENDDDDMKRKRLNKNNRLKPKEGQGDECLEFCGQPVCVTTVRSLVRIQFKKEELQIEVKRYIFWR